MIADNIFTEARARITWGETPSNVRQFLITNGVTVSEADARLIDFEHERNRELRKIGIRNVLIGFALTIAAAYTFYIALPIASGFNSGWNKALAVVLLAGVYGLWKLAKGLIYLVKPQSEHKSIADIEQSDIIE